MSFLAFPSGSGGVWRRPTHPGGPFFHGSSDAVPIFGAHTIVTHDWEMCADALRGCHTDPFPWTQVPHPGSETTDSDRCVALMARKWRPETHHPTMPHKHAVPHGPSDRIRVEAPSKSRRRFKPKANKFTRHVKTRSHTTGPPLTFGERDAMAIAISELE